MRAPRPSDPDIGRHLLRDEGEVIVDVVHHHWVAYAVPLLECRAGGAPARRDLGGARAALHVPFVLALLLFAHAAWGAARERKDRFVITNMRVFRVHGVLSQRLATMPLHRILDITVVKPLHGADPGLRPLHLRVRRPGPGAARHPVRRPRPTSATSPSSGSCSAPACAAPGSSTEMTRLPFDPIDEAARQWGARWTGCRPCTR